LIGIETELDHTDTETTSESNGLLGVAIECADEEQAGTSRWYSLELGSEGAEIRRRPFGESSSGTLAASPDVVSTEEPTELGATCRLTDQGCELSLVVDGGQILVVTSVARRD